MSEGYYTVRSLIKALKQLEDMGLGNREIIVPTDEEGNMYRPLPEQDILVEREDIDEYVSEDYTAYVIDFDNIVVL